uniref:Uncharacterized protein n=1 Tax=Anguilla anguilla TaxID=7936 RepID=A0A0E9X3D9_ANGAN
MDVGKRSELNGLPHIKMQFHRCNGGRALMYCYYAVNEVSFLLNFQFFFFKHFYFRTIYYSVFLNFWVCAFFSSFGFFFHFAFISV